MVPAQAMSDAQAFQLDAQDWRGYFEAMAVDHEGLKACVTLVSERPQDGEDAVAWTLYAISYDQHADEIEIHVGHPAPRGPILRYFVSAPRAIHVQERAGGKVIAVHDMSGVRTLIQVAHPRESGALPCRSRRSVSSARSELGRQRR